MYMLINKQNGKKLASFEWHRFEDARWAADCRNTDCRHMGLGNLVVVVWVD